jgi:hypothetical protein
MTYSRAFGYLNVRYSALESQTIDHVCRNCFDTLHDSQHHPSVQDVKTELFLRFLQLVNVLVLVLDIFKPQQHALYSDLHVRMPRQFTRRH